MRCCRNALLCLLFGGAVFVVWILFSEKVLAAGDAGSETVQSCRLTILTPKQGEKAYGIAGQIFSNYWEKVTGEHLSVQEYNGRLPAGNLVVIGSDAVHPVSHELIKAGFIDKFKIRYGSDDYHVLSVNDEERNILIFAGSSGRSTIYAVYDFFRKCTGAAYFWDGDVIPKHDFIDITKVNFSEQPHFKYRGLRYFAHRGLHRFRAEQWSLEDWKREIDWIMKKRFNIFMLRTGIDDLFQRTFPGKVPYPPEDGLDPDGRPRSYDQRTSPWPLKFRGDLRKKVLEYAFDRGLLHPADCGTITHWYSHTPSSFYDSHPSFPVLGQKTPGYNTPTLRVWDIEHEHTWATYWKLTETSIREYGPQQAKIFHTIGLAERLFENNRRQNLQIKLYALRKTQQVLREHYPDAPLLIASWDFVYWWQDEEVRTLCNELDPSRTIILDYTSDISYRKPYRQWTYGRFPWIFGLLHAFAGNTEVRGNYYVLNERLKEATADPYCKGFVLWPEVSHSDTFMLEYFAENSWNPGKSSLEHAVERYCSTRYTAGITKKMAKLWSDFLLISQTNAWGKRPRHKMYHTDLTPGYRTLQDRVFTDLSSEKIEYFKQQEKRFRPVLAASPSILNRIAQMSEDNYTDPLWRRDAIDIARTIIDKAIFTVRMRLAIEMEAWRTGKANVDKIHRFEKASLALMSTLADVLSESDEFSLYHSLKKLKETAPVNPFTEQVLKANSENGYCRHHVYEMVRHLYPKELSAFLSWVNKRIKQTDKREWKKPEEFRVLKRKIQDEYYETSLSEMAPSKKRSATCFSNTFDNAAKVLKNALEI